MGLLDGWLRSGYWLAFASSSHRACEPCLPGVREAQELTYLRVAITPVRPLPRTLVAMLPALRQDASLLQELLHQVGAVCRSRRTIDQPQQQHPEV